MLKHHNKKAYRGHGDSPPCFLISDPRWKWAVIHIQRHKTYLLEWWWYPEHVWWFWRENCHLHVTNRTPATECTQISPNNLALISAAKLERIQSETKLYGLNKSEMWIITEMQFYHSCYLLFTLKREIGMRETSVCMYVSSKALNFFKSFYGI